MKADLTRSTFRPEKHYSGVRMQQGRVQLDADWNEQVDIDAHRENTTRYDVIGPCGAPKADAGFEIGVTPDGSDLTLTPGRIYVDGVLCELESTPIRIVGMGSSDASLLLEEIVADEHELKTDDWVELATDDRTTTVMAKVAKVPPATLAPEKREVTLTLAGAAPALVLFRTLRWVVTYLTQPDFPHPLPEKPGDYLAYLDVWQQHVTSLEDRVLRETALGGPDTATRTRTTWQLKLFHAAGDQEVSCSSEPEPSDFPTATTGRLAARAQPQTTAADPCTIPPGAGYRRLENQLYRVEIHDPGNLDEATFKWSRENGSVVSSWLANRSLTEVEVSSLGRDDVLGFAGGNLVELTSDLDELAGTPGQLVQVTKPGDSSLFLSADALSVPDKRVHSKVRRWEGQHSVTTGWLALEDGIEVEFAEGWYNTGDYWEIPARTPAGDVEWPQDSGGTPLLRPPDGIAHGYCKLAALSFVNDWKVIKTCRPTFPALTGLDSGTKPDDEVKPDAGIHVVSVQMATGHPLPNDSSLTVQQLERGIDIYCDGKVDPSTIKDRPTCLVTVDLPYPFLPQGGARFGTFPVTLDAMNDVSDAVIQWRPIPSETVRDQLNKILTDTDRPLLLHLTLKGNFVYGAGKPELNIDGEVFGVMKGDVLDVTLPDLTSGDGRPSGDGRRGGDLEMWFRLKPD